MTLRLCVIGNSHLAAYKLGWDALVAAGDPLSRALAPVFFGAPRDGIRHLRAEGDRLVAGRKDLAESLARTSGGRDEIVPAEFDAVLLIGLSVSIKRVLRLYKTHLWHGLAEDPARSRLPRRFVLDFLSERYGDTVLADTGRKLRQVTALPILVVAEPFWAVSARDSRDDKPDYGWDRAIARGDAPQLGAIFDQAIGQMVHGWARFVPQAPETVADGILTRASFNKEASRLISGEGGGSDAAHMNGAFGAAMWPGIAAALQVAPAAAEPV